MSVKIHLREPDESDRRYIGLMKELVAARFVGDYIDPENTMEQCCCGELSQWVTFLRQPGFMQMICADCRDNPDAIIKRKPRRKRLYFDAEYKPLHAIHIRNEHYQEKGGIVHTLTVIKRQR